MCFSANQALSVLLICLEIMESLRGLKPVLEQIFWCCKLYFPVPANIYLFRSPLKCGWFFNRFEIDKISVDLTIWQRHNFAFGKHFTSQCGQIVQANIRMLTNYSINSSLYDLNTYSTGNTTNL